MSLISLAQEIDLEQEVIVAILDGALRNRGSEKALAAKAGVTPVYLSYIRGLRSIPRLRTAQRIARVLPLPIEQRVGWLHHVERIRNLRRQTQRQIRQEARERPMQELVQEIKEAHNAATFAQDPAAARRLYREVKTSAGLLLQACDPNQDPINYIELCFLMHEADSILNRNDEALWYSKRARLVAQSIDDPREYHMARECLDFFQVNALRAEAVALHNLKLYRQAYARCREAEETAALKRNGQFWKPHLYRDVINALEGIPRFSITLAENLADQVRDICETRTDDLDPLLEFLVSQSLARAYIRHRNFKDARHVLTAQYDRLEQIAHLGPLHRVLFLRTFARLYLAQDALGAEWEYLIDQAIRISAEAGLEHQLNEIREEYRGKLKEDLGLAV